MAIQAPERETTARLRYLRTSPSKVRQVVNLIRGQDVGEARDRLRLCERSAAREVRKTLDAAVANAEHNNNLPEDELYVVRAFVDEGPTLKRWRPRARGRGVRIRKRTSHLTIAVARFADDELQRRRRAEAAEGGPSRRRPTRRRAPRVEEHDHDHDDEHDEGDEPAPRATAKKTTKKATTKGTAKKATAAKSAATKKATTKKATTKKATAQKKGTGKKSPARKRTPRKGE